MLSTKYKILSKFIKNRAGYWLFKRMVQLIYLFLGMSLLKEYILSLHSDLKISLDIPPEIKNFEDLHWLFFSTFLNRGIIKMDLDEAAYLFKTIRGGLPMHLLEIGTYKGGSTMLISAAKPKEAEFVSLDLEDRCHPKVRELLDKNTRLLREDSRKFIPQNKLDFIFIDGEHSFEGIQADFEHYFSHLNKGADILLHDAVRTRKYTFIATQTNAFIKTIEKRRGLKFVKDVGTLRHLKKYD